jgi:hypothetical protein
LHGKNDGDHNRRTMRALLLAVIVAASCPALALCADDFDAQAALFRYDPAVDLKVEEAGVEKQGTVSVHDIRFAPVPGADPVKAYVVVPEGKGPFAGVLWVHWLGEPATTNRTQFLKEAVELAPKGMVSLLVEGMWSAPDWYGKRVRSRTTTTRSGRSLPCGGPWTRSTAGRDKTRVGTSARLRRHVRERTAWTAHTYVTSRSCRRSTTGRSSRASRCRRRPTSARTRPWS